MKPSKQDLIVHPRASEIVPEARGEFPLVHSDQAIQEIVSVIDDNMAGQKMSLFNFSQIKAPSGGGMALSVDGASGRQAESEIKGIIVAYRSARVFWKRAYGSGGGKKPPDCSSQNGLVGVGDPGGNCDECPNNQFGTASNPDGSKGAGMACKEIRQALILLPGLLLPHLLNVPPTSIKAFDKYVWNLSAEGVRYWSVVTRIKPELSTSSGGIDFARLRFLKERVLDPHQARRLRPYSERMQGFLKPMTVDATAYETASEPEEAPEPPSAPSAESELPF